jgi:hypothetical protein
VGRLVVGRGRMGEIEWGWWGGWGRDYERGVRVVGGGG